MSKLDLSSPSSSSIAKDLASEQRREKNAQVERTNLLNMLKLSIKALIESYMELRKQITDGHRELEQFFIILEDILRHRIRTKRNILGAKREFLGALEAIEKVYPDISSNLTSAKTMPGIKTILGKCRAWLRLSLMGKCIADDFKALIDNKQLLVDWYEPDSIIFTEDAVVIGGLLQSLNALDYNLTSDGSEFDIESIAIDFSMFLKDGNYLKTSNPPSSPTHAQNASPGTNEFSMLLDQKAYLEELNKKLTQELAQANIIIEEQGLNLKTKKLEKSDLEVKLDTTVKELSDLKTIVESSSLVHKKELEVITSDLDVERETYQHSRSTLNELYQAVQKQLESELKLRQELEKELSGQRHLRSESEVATRLLEKNIQEKQDSIISMREQLSETKISLVQMQSKIEEQTEIASDQSQRIESLETTCGGLSKDNQILRTEIQRNKEQLQISQHSATQLTSALNESEQRFQNTERDLKMERQWRTALQSELEQVNTANLELTKESEQLAALKIEHEGLQIRVGDLQEACAEQEIALVEMGQSLSSAHQNLSNVKLSNRRMWVEDRTTNDCQKCQKSFTMKRRRHHCRNCGGIYCAACSDNNFSIAASSKPVRVCDNCYNVLCESLPQ
ncbi:RUN and FYVE domain-containing protein 2-like [Oopsacas minuta]|uniref:RUN and FYVE domain-containing protein 2-like n=1 Tax=Oopsacas minuta TaxID=111878 RepID=A0AAV7JDT1_9METZ|nr:RUN and FYVE domain-containing protein 2-like [Oopsacas minuta]